MALAARSKAFRSIALESAGCFPICPTQNGMTVVMPQRGHFIKRLTGCEKFTDQKAQRAIQSPFVCLQQFERGLFPVRDIPQLARLHQQNPIHAPRQLAIVCHHDDAGFQ